MLIVFEGIDNSGKSTLSLAFQKYINNDFRSVDGVLKVDPHLGDFVWTKEPMFTSEEADTLNSPSFTNQFARERLFFESRMRHQDMVSGKNLICDRYIWSGIAYALKFSPECYEFARALYLSDTLFIQPDLYIFVDTPPEVCFDRDPSVELDRLKSLQQAYLSTQQFITTPVITMQAIGGEQCALDQLVELFENFVDEHDLMVDQEKW
jgi:thymidylate kinase